MVLRLNNNDHDSKAKQQLTLTMRVRGETVSHFCHTAPVAHFILHIVAPVDHSLHDTKSLQSLFDRLHYRGVPRERE